MLNPSGTVEMANIQKRMLEEGKDVILLSLGEPDFKTPEDIIKSAEDTMIGGHTGYTPSKGITELREEIAKKCRLENGIDCDVENIIVAPAKYCIYSSLLSILNPGDEVIICEPFWCTYDAIVRVCDGIPVHIRCDEKLCIDTDELKNKISDKTKAVIINSPNNPTGAVYDKNILRKVADICCENDLFVISDEVYEKIIFEGEHISIASIPEMIDRTIVINSFSKSFAMTGWRVGWAVAPEEIINAMDKFHQHSITCASAPSQYAALYAIRNSKKFKFIREEFKKRREFLVKGLKEMDCMDCVPPRGTFYAFPKYILDVDSYTFAMNLLKNYGVSVAPGDAFGSIIGKHHIRISFSASIENIDEGLKRIEKAVKEWR